MAKNNNAYELFPIFMNDKKQYRRNIETGMKRESIGQSFTVGDVDEASEDLWWCSGGPGGSAASRASGEC